MTERRLESLQALTAHLEQQGLRPLPRAGGLSLALTLGGTRPGTLLVDWSDEQALVRFELRLGVPVPPARAAEVISLIARINQEIALHGFVVDGEVSFVTAAMLDHEQTLSSVVFDRCVRLCTTEAERHLGSIEQAAKEIS